MSPSPPHAGDLIRDADGRRYTILETLGAGGFGSVYRARLAGASGFARQVAIKVMHTSTGAHPELAQRFRDEARLLGLLRHRALVQVLDLIPVDEGWALVMEYVPGADLSTLSSAGALPARSAAEIIAEVASALAAAHCATDPETGEPLGLIHRDIKPANIRLAPEGEVKLLDFGVAHARFSVREAETRSLAFGSMGYLAPERLEGMDLPASDVYALGVVMLECLRGRPLGPLPVDPRRHQNAVVAALTPLWPQVAGASGQALFNLCESMTHYNPEWRPRATEVEDRLRELLPGLPGPWLRQWAPGAVHQALRGLPPGPSPSRDVRTPTPNVLPAAQDPAQTEWVRVYGGPPDSATLHEPGRQRASAVRTRLATLCLGMLGTGALVTGAWILNGSLTSTPPLEPPLVVSGEVMTAPPPVNPLTPAPEPTPPPPEPTPPPADSPSSSETRAPRTGPAPTLAMEAATPRPAPAQTEPTPTPAAEEVTPEPSPMPDPAPLTTATILVRGDHLEAHLVDAQSGERLAPGEVPPGEYSLSVRIAPDRVIEYTQNTSQVSAGDTVVWTCSAQVGGCRKTARRAQATP